MQGSATDQGVIRLAIQDVFTNIEKVSHLRFVILTRQPELMGAQTCQVAACGWNSVWFYCYTLITEFFQSLLSRSTVLEDEPTSQVQSMFYME